MNMHFLRALLPILSLLFLTTAQAGWQRFDGPNGGTVKDLVIHGGTHFAATEHGLYQSADGANWSLVTGLPEAYFNSLASNGSVVIVGGYSHGVFRSTNGGSTWQSVDVTAVNDLIWHDGCFYSVNDNSGIRRSCNGGLSWTDADPNDQLGSFMQHLGTDGTYLYSIGAGMLFRTNDQGITWTNLMSGLPAFASVVRIAGNADQQLLTTNQHGMFRSTDHGQSWTPTVPHTAPVGTWQGTALLVEGNTVHVGINPYGGVRRSTDGGLTWAPVSQGLAPSLLHHALVRSGNDLLLATNRGIWRGAGAMPQWAHADGGIPHTSLAMMVEQGPALFATTRATEAGQSEGVHRSTDGGLTWQPRNAGLAAELNFDALFAGNGFLLASAQLNTYRSTDAGLTWTNLLQNGPSGDVTAIVEWNGALYAGTYGSGIFRSADDGLTWQPVPSSNLITSLHATPGALYAGTTSGLQRTINGTTWTSLTNGLSGTLQIEAIVSRPGLLVVSAKSGAYTQFHRSTDGGNSFQPANSGLPAAVYCAALAFHNDSLFAGFDASWPQTGAALPGLYASADGGLTWSDASEGMPAGTSVRCFLNTSDGRLLAGTHREGVWGRGGTLSTEVPEASAAPAMAIWPNPTTGSIQLRTDDGDALGMIEVADALGAVVHTERHSAPQATIDLAGLPAGLYYVRTQHQDRQRVQRVVKLDR
jgi:photosystem II stability/assembly factor-like uncharacterized protein